MTVMLFLEGKGRLKNSNVTAFGSITQYMKENFLEFSKLIYIAFRN